MKIYFTCDFPGSWVLEPMSLSVFANEHASLHIFKVTESKGNVYMYDDNHESSRVTSGITRLQLQFPAGVRKGRIVIQENLPGMHP